MSIQTLDTNIIAVLAEPWALLPSPNSFFESLDFEDILRQPFRYSQNASIDVARSVAVPMSVVESSNQLSVNLGQLRVEVHDQSAQPTITGSVLPDLLHLVFAKLPPVRLLAVGVNLEGQVSTTDGMTAAREIGDKVLKVSTHFEAQGLHLVAGSARYGMQGQDGTTYTVSIEPRFNAPDTRNVWLACNGSIEGPELPDRVRLMSALREGYAMLSHALETFFPEYSESYEK